MNKGQLVEVVAKALGSKSAAEKAIKKKGTDIDAHRQKLYYRMMQEHQAAMAAAEAVEAKSGVKSAPSTSDTEFTTGIINLANNPDYSIETMAHEANRLKKKAEQSHDPDEVVISLR